MPGSADKRKEFVKEDQQDLEKNCCSVRRSEPLSFVGLDCKPVEPG
jgi:hypothetical protein